MSSNQLRRTARPETTRRVISTASRRPLGKPSYAESRCPQRSSTPQAESRNLSRCRRRRRRYPGPAATAPSVRY
ncbi:hypothetical protein CDEST_10001 [Colletotrichum destructivum]|uniref:Uncharacterized protein n=1 Tax=Colletotrichum destructivum TaxID=34406 RepID=A0AAX4INN7_9PEZI|nr:hypothetical protein CDEST_10001 [Colletotrichum destructivum]